MNKLIIIGNGFDLAHGLKTSYRDFIDWYMCEAFKAFTSYDSYEDQLISIQNRAYGFRTNYSRIPTTGNEVLELINVNTNQQIIYKSNFFKDILLESSQSNWVDLECDYFRRLKLHFSNASSQSQSVNVKNLNSEFNFLITQLTLYIEKVNSEISSKRKLFSSTSGLDMQNAFNAVHPSQIRFLNFNYTDTLLELKYVDDPDVIFIHGRVSQRKKYPIIFGYGDETDSSYQKIEDTGDNSYLEHIKSFGYFLNDNYSRLISYVDADPFLVYIVGHSCGLSDRVLLSEIFEHPNCTGIEIFFYVDKQGRDNYKEITQNISRHFRPQNKTEMRRKIRYQLRTNLIPQQST